MAEVLVRVCDVCLTPGDTVRHYTITVGDDSITLDLCDKDAGPVSPAVWKKQPEPQAKRPAKKAPAKRTGRPRQRTMTLEEIEELKKAQ